MHHKCDHCDKEATVHEVAVRNGVKIERHLCEACAEKHGISVQPPTAMINDLVKNFMLAHAQGGPALASRAGVCPACKATFHEFKQHQLLGCPLCYDAFKAQLMPLLERAHDGGNQHTGKMPIRKMGLGAKQGAAIADAPQGNQGVQAGLSPSDRAKRLTTLRHELHGAVQQEKYELAARIRDEVRKLETGATAGEAEQSPPNVEAPGGAGC